MRATDGTLAGPRSERVPVGCPAAMGEPMGKYLFTGSFTQAGAHGIIAEGGSGRRDAIASLCASAGGRLESYHFAFGSDDFFVIADVPSPEAAAAAALTVSASGAASVRTIVLMTPEEMDVAHKLSPHYRAPGEIGES